MKKFITLLFLLQGFCAIARSECDSERIYFRQGHSVLEPGLHGNREALKRIADSLWTYAGPTGRLRRIEVTGGASPEGSVLLNKRLSEKRAKALLEHLSREGGIPDSLLSFTFLGRDWGGLIRLVENDPGVPCRDAVLELLHDIAERCRGGEKAEDANAARLAHFKEGEPYRYMYRKLFPEEGGEPVQYHLAGKAGGVVSLAEGRYDVLALNGDTEKIRFADTKRLDGFTVGATSGSLLASMGRGGDNVPRAEGTEDQAVLLPPDMVYGACLRGVTVRRETDQTITLYPNEKVCRYTVEIVHVKNLDYVSQLSGTLSGMAGEMLPASDRLSGPACIVPFEVRETDATTVRAEFLTFGHCPVPAIPHKIVIYGVLTRGTQQYRVYGDTDDPVTPQIHDAPDPRRVFIRLDGLEFDPAAGSSGMNPTIDDWGEVNVDIDM